MRLGQIVGSSVYGQPISSYFSEAASNTAWNGVTQQNTLNMAIGNYTSSGYEVDEAGTAMSNLFLAVLYASKMSDALVFPRKSPPEAHVAAASNGGTYDVFSDNDEFSWNGTVVDANKLSPMG